MKIDELKKNYRKVFSADGGDVVLADILNLCGYFSNMPDSMDVKLIALANTILTRLNIYDTTDVKDFVARMVMTAPPIKETRNDDSYEGKEE